MRIAFYGGSFNPPHLAHNEIVKRLNDFDLIYVMPDGDFYPKAGLVSFDHRYNMLKLMLQEKIDSGKVILSDYENNSTLRYAYESLDYIQGQYPDAEVFLVIGADNFKTLKSWKNYEYIIKNYSIMIFLRGGRISDFDISQYKNIEFRDAESDISSSVIRKSINKGLDIKNMLSSSVYDYIIDNGLYK